VQYEHGQGSDRDMLGIKINAVFRNRPRRLSAALLLSAAFTAVTPAVLAQLVSQQQAPARAELSGHVVTAPGKPVNGALVMLKTGEGSAPITTTTDVSGSFIFKALRPGNYAVSAEMAGVHSSDFTVVLSEGIANEIRIVLDSSGTIPAVSTSASPLSGEGMEFSDKPNFTVAGVTDWTAAGGHGSDATLRTSEDLTRETLRLKAQGTASVAPGGQGRNRGEGKTEASLLAALAATPRSYAANHDLGMFYLRSARYEQALTLLQAASELNHATADDDYYLALACQGVGDFARAQQHIQRALARSDAADYHRLAGELEEKLGDPLAAVRQEERAAQMAPSEENYFVWGSELLLHRAIWQAGEVFAKGTKAHPNSARMRTAWGAALFAGALYDEAAKQLCEASDLEPENSAPYLFMGRIVLASPTPLPCVRQKLKRFLREQPENADAAYFYAMSLSRQGTTSDPQRVEALLRKAVALNPKHAGAYLQLGILSFAQRDYPASIRFYTKAIEADPQQGEAHYRLAVAYDRAGDAEKARREFQLHDTLGRVQADAIEQQRRQVKQFLVTLQGQPPSYSAKP
jgi:tetratricopeptide (TPR) repeat protein